MAKKKKPANPWDDHHKTLGDAEKIRIRKLIEKACEWSTETFYRKKREPHYLKWMEKQLVAQAYGIPLKTFFPDTKPISLPTA